MGKHEILKAAIDEFSKIYKSQVDKYCFNMAVGITRVKEDSKGADPQDIGKFAIAAFCQFENPSKDLTDKVKSAIEGIIPKKFEYEGVEYPIEILYRGIPELQ